MTKHYCDNCGKETNPEDELMGREGKIAFKVIAGAISETGHTIWSAGDFCHECIINAINTYYKDKLEKGI